MTVVCGTDFSSSSIEALHTAATIARRRAEKVLLIHVVQPAPSDPVENYSDMLRDVSIKQLEKIAHEGELGGVEVATLVVAGSPADEIVRNAPADTSLIVVSGRGHAHGIHLLVGSVAERLAHISPHPLLVVRHPGPLQEWLNGRIRLQVMIATDLTPASDYALERASMLADLGPCDVELTYIQQVPDETAAAYDVITPELKNRIAKTKFGGETRTHSVVTLGRIAARIADVANVEHVDLIVVGTHQRHALARLWHESVAHGVLHGTPANVLCIPFALAADAEHAIEEHALA